MMQYYEVEEREGVKFMPSMPIINITNIGSRYIHVQGCFFLTSAHTHLKIPIYQQHTAVTLAKDNMGTL